jgi:hypothetical protein
MLVDVVLQELSLSHSRLEVCPDDVSAPYEPKRSYAR